MSMKAADRLRYIPALDGLRAIAVLLVMLGHTGVPGFPGGGFGVDIFFTLSGFLITTLLLEEIEDKGRLNLLSFYARRLLRLYPALLLMLLLYGLFCHILRHALPHAEKLESAKDIALAGFYLTDYAIAFGFQSRNSLLAHTWSLAVEEHFYLVWPLLLPALRRMAPGKKLAALLATLYLAATAWRLFSLSFQSWEIVYFRFDTRFAGLVLGALLAVCRREGIKIPGVKYGLLLSGLAFVYSVVTMPDMEALTIESAIPEIFTFFLIQQILEAKEWRPAAWLSHKIPVFLGRISYALYLFHFPVAALFLRSSARWWISFEVTLAIAVALAWFSWNTVEKAGRFKAKAFRQEKSQRHIPDEKGS